MRNPTQFIYITFRKVKVSCHILTILLAVLLAACSPTDARQQQRGDTSSSNTTTILQAEAKHNAHIAVGLGVIALLAALLAFVLTVRMRSVKRKNAALSREIAESYELRDKYLKAVRIQQEILQEKNPRPAPTDLTALSDAELFEHISSVIVSEKLFQDPLFDRLQAMNRFHLSKDRIGAVFARGSSYSSLRAYINDIRLSYGAKLLTEQPELSITEVSKACGFTSSSVFARNFKKKYAITATEYKECSQESIDA